MNILIGLIPAIMWGFLPIIIKKTGGQPINQLLGTTYGALIIALIFYFIKQPIITINDFWWCLLSGAAWSFGQITQYTSFVKMGVSNATPISTGMQLIGNPLIGVLFFNEWSSLSAKIIGIIAIVLIIIGVFFTSKSNNKNDQSSINNSSFSYGFWILFIGTFGYMGYSAFPRVSNTNSWAALLPQTIGMVIAAIAFSFIIKSYRIQRPIFNKSSLINILTGLDFGIATFAYLTSAKLNGVATGFTISQMNLIVATLGSILILGERKTYQGYILMTIGLILLVISGLMIGSID